jgi:5'-nucleotidase
MLLILTNDDGIDAPGLSALFRATEGLGERRVIAPVGPWSAKSHAVTTHEPFRVLRREGGWFAVEGTPADCVRVGLHHLAPGADWVLSGINAGGNLGADIHHSGTVAAAREGVLHGRPAVAISHYITRSRAIDWDRATRWTAFVVKKLMVRTWQPGTFWNVNLPHLDPDGPVPDVFECRLDPSPLPLRFDLDGDTVQYTGDYQNRARLPDHDVDLCFRGNITVSRVHLFV